MSNTYLNRLVSLMPPHGGAGDSGDWTAVEAGWGKAFPSDYKKFISIYGMGDIEDCIAILCPDELLPYEAPKPGMFEETENARGILEEFGTSGASIESPAEIIAWGGDPVADMLCWLCRGDNPDEWPTLVWNRGRDEWVVYECGMVEFLFKVLSAEFDECPLGITDAWGCDSPSFVHWRLQRARQLAGLDPWTGAPIE